MWHFELYETPQIETHWYTETMTVTSISPRRSKRKIAASVLFYLLIFSSHRWYSRCKSCLRMFYQSSCGFIQRAPAGLEAAKIDFFLLCIFHPSAIHQWTFSPCTLSFKNRQTTSFSYQIPLWLQQWKPFKNSKWSQVISKLQQSVFIHVFHINACVGCVVTYEPLHSYMQTHSLQSVRIWFGDNVHSVKLAMFQPLQVSQKWNSWTIRTLSVC